MSGRKPVLPIATLLEQGKIVALNFPARMARAIGVMLKMDFQRALNRIPHITKEPDRLWRPIVFVCDEYQLIKNNSPGRDVANVAAKISDENIPRSVGRLLRQDR